MEDTFIQQLVLWVSVAVVAANAITATFPSVKENKVYNFIMSILNFVSMNFGKNKNADTEKK